MVSCPHALASEAGVEVLKAGGSAVDAAIAASAVLSVIYPHMVSIGGDAFWLIYDARRRAVRFLNAAGCAASSATIEWFRSRGHAEIPLRGVLPGTVTVPGAVDGWCQAHDAGGRLTLARDLASAVGYARDGFPVSRRLADWTEQSTTLLKENQEAAAIFLPGGAPPRAGQRLRNPNLALTLERIATEGRAGFYEGETAREMARFAREGGGLHAERDFARQRAEWGEPLSTTYRGVAIHVTAPPTQGISVLQMLNLVESLDLPRLRHNSAAYAHTLVEAMKLAFADREAYYGDPHHVDVPAASLLSPGTRG